MSHLFIMISKMLGIAPGLLAAVCFVESNHNPKAMHKNDGHGNHTSYGLCQVQLATAREFLPGVSAEDLLDPYINAQAAGLYLKKQIKHYKNIEKALAVYNAGRLLLKDDGSIINQKYVTKVKKRWKTEQKNLLILANLVKEK